MPKIARYVLRKGPEDTTLSIVEHAARGALVTVAIVRIKSRAELVSGMYQLAETRAQKKLPY